MSDPILTPAPADTVTSPRHVAAADTNAAPAIPAQARTVIYVTSLIVNIVGLVAVAVLPILGVLTIIQSLAIGGVLFGALSLLNSGLGTGYRPTRNLPTE